MNINYYPEEFYNAYFFHGETTLEGILSLKTTDFQTKKPGLFYIGFLEWDHATLEAFLDILNYFKEQGIQWEEFRQAVYPRHQSFTFVLLQTVNGLNIFKKMNLTLNFHGDDEYLAEFEYLFPGINQNKQLESLHVGIWGDHSDRFEDEGFNSLSLFLRDTTNLK